MKKIATLLVTLVTASVWAQGYVAPYIKKDGAYVEGHYKSQPNTTKTDNYSSQGNTNPYTGKTGTVDPYKQPTPTYGQQCGTNSRGEYVCR